MTFDANQPNASESPANFPTPANVNNTRIKTLINAEHVFNDTAQADDGVHRQMTMIARTDPVSVPAGTSAMLYTKIVSGTPQLYFYDGTIARLIGDSGTLSIAARASWNSAGTVFGPNFNATVSFNASSKVYTITFPTPLSALGLQFSLEGFAVGLPNRAIIPKILSYTQNVMTLQMLAEFTATSQASGYLIIFGA